MSLRGRQVTLWNIPQRQEERFQQRRESLDRRLDDQSSWNSATTQVWFRTQAAINANLRDDSYYLYYGYSSAGTPPTTWSNIFLFYDDFNDGSFDTGRWTCVSGTCTESGGNLTLGTYSKAWATASYSFGTDTRWESRAQLEIYDFVRSLAPDAVLSDRTVIAPKELDIWVPSSKFAIEFNGLFWHSETVLGDPMYHQNKHASCTAQALACSLCTKMNGETSGTSSKG
jgi:hypothetical protein